MTLVQRQAAGERGGATEGLEGGVVSLIDMPGKDGLPTSDSERAECKRNLFSKHVSVYFAKWVCLEYRF